MLADFDEDGALDIVSSGPALRLGHGDGMFAPGADLVFTSGRGSLVSGDIDGDGHLDLLASGTGSGTSASTMLFLGSGGGGFRLHEQTPTAGLAPINMTAAAIGRFNADLFGDLLVTTPTTTGGGTESNGAARVFLADDDARLERDGRGRPVDRRYRDQGARDRGFQQRREARFPRRERGHAVGERDDGIRLPQHDAVAGDGGHAADRLRREPGPDAQRSADGLGDEHRGGRSAHLRHRDDRQRPRRLPRHVQWLQRRDPAARRAVRGAAALRGEQGRQPGGAVGVPRQHRRGHPLDAAAGDGDAARRRRWRAGLPAVGWACRSDGRDGRDGRGRKAGRDWRDWCRRCHGRHRPAGRDRRARARPAATPPSRASRSGPLGQGDV